MAKRILIVEDESDIAESVQRAMRRLGYEASAEGDGLAAWRRIQAELPDLVVLDLMLPGRSGFLALEKIKGRSDSPSVIMVTANEGRRHAEYAEQMGVDAYLVKPVPLGQLIEHIERLTASA